MPKKRHLKNFQPLSSHNNLWYQGIMLVLGGIGGAIVFAVIAFLLPIRYEASMTLEVLQPREEGEFYTYDGYYSLQAAELAAHNVEMLFISPAFIEKVLNQSQPELAEALTNREMRRLIKAEKVSRSIIEVSYSMVNQELAKSRAKAITDTIEARLSNQEARYTVDISEPVIRLQRPSYALWSLAGALLAALIVLSKIIVSDLSKP